jgi:hypothetical protein
MEEVLIIKQMEILHTEFVNLLAEEKVDGMFSTCRPSVNSPGYDYNWLTHVLWMQN